MQKNTLLSNILADFLKENPDTNVDAVQEFCDYAEGWFRKSGIIGLGCTADGMALRLADAQEILFFSPEAQSFDVGPGVPISGAQQAKNIKMPEQVTSFQITGR